MRREPDRQTDKRTREDRQMHKVRSTQNIDYPKPLDITDEFLDYRNLKNFLSKIASLNSCHSVTLILLFSALYPLLF